MYVAVKNDEDTRMKIISIRELLEKTPGDVKKKLPARHDLLLYN